MVVATQQVSQPGQRQFLASTDSFLNGHASSTPADPAPAVDQAFARRKPVRDSPGAANRGY